MPTETFCEGANKAELDGQLAVPVAITASLRVLCVCQWAATVDVHSRSVLGHDLLVSISFCPWEPGEVDLSETGDGLSVQVFQKGEPWPNSPQPLSGWLRWEQPGDPDHDPSLLSFCITVEDPESEVQGARLFAEDLVLMPWSWSERLTLRLLADPDLSAVDAAALPLESLELDVPLLNLLRLRYYVWSEHRFVLDPEFSSIIEQEVGEPPFYGRSFVVTVDDEQIYLGAFMSEYSSATFDGPTILLPPPPLDQEEGEYVIDPGYPGGGPIPTPDPRDDPRLRNLLEAAGKLVP